MRTYNERVKLRFYEYIWHREGKPMDDAPSFSSLQDKDFEKIAGTTGGFSILCQDVFHNIAKAINDCDKFYNKNSSEDNNEQPN